MAYLSHLSMRAYLMSGGQRLPLYEPQIQGNTVSCWVEGQPQQIFSINWEDLGTGVETVAYITIDGHVVPGRFLFGKGMAWRMGIRTGHSTERPFMFSDVGQGHAEPLPDGRVPDASKLGTIVLSIRQISRTYGHACNPITPKPDVMRGMSHKFDLCVGLAPEVQTYDQPLYTWSFKSYDDANPGAYVKFIFRYRSPEWITDQGLHRLVQPMRDTWPNTRRTLPASSSATTPLDLTASGSGSKRQRVPSTSQPRKARRTASKSSPSTGEDSSQGTEKDVSEGLDQSFEADAGGLSFDLRALIQTSAAKIIQASQK